MLRGSKRAKKISPSPLHNQQPEPLTPNRISLCWLQILTLPSECCSRSRDSDGQHFLYIYIYSIYLLLSNFGESVQVAASFRLVARSMCSIHMGFLPTDLPLNRYFQFSRPFCVKPVRKLSVTVPAEQQCVTQNSPSGACPQACFHHVYMCLNPLS